MLEVGRGVDGAAHLAIVAILILGAALGAFAFDEAIGQEHALVGIKKLLDRALNDQTFLAQSLVDVLGQLVVFGCIGRVPVIEGNVKAIQVGGPAGCHLSHESLGRETCFFRGDHDGSAVGIVGTDEFHVVALHSLKANPEVRLDVFHDVAHVKGAIGVGQGGGDK